MAVFDLDRASLHRRRPAIQRDRAGRVAWRRRRMRLGGVSSREMSSRAIADGDEVAWDEEDQTLLGRGRGRVRGMWRWSGELVSFKTKVTAYGEPSSSWCLFT